MKVLDIDGLNYYDGKIKQTYATKSYVDTQDALKAPLASPALTGTPTAPTPTAGDDSTKLATTAYVQGELSNFTPSGSFLPLSGGTMTGTINFSSAGNNIRATSDDGYLVFYGGDANTSASIVLRGNNYTQYNSAGSFSIRATNGNTYTSLQGESDGTLTWGGDKVATFNSNNKLVFPDGTTVWIS